MEDFKTKMRDKIKKYSNEQYLDGFIKNEFLTDDGDADIFLNVSEKSELFDTWTIGEQIDLESDVYDYVEEKSSMLGNDIQIKLIITDVNLLLGNKNLLDMSLKNIMLLNYIRYRRNM